MMVAPIEVPPAVGREATTQGPLGVLAEYHDSGVIEDDMQTATITDRWVVTGTPTEAFLSPGMQGLTVKTKHHTLSDAYLVKRRFAHLSKSETVADRRTIVTLVYQRRPCPWAYEDSEVGTLVSMPTWWSQDPDPINITSGAEVSLAIMQPSRLLIRRYPAVSLSGNEVENIMEQMGRTNNQPFRSRPAKYWLLQNIRSKMLYGDPLTRDGVYEITLYFLADPIRAHEIWIIQKESGVLKRPISNSFEHMAAVHDRTTQYPQSTVTFESLVPIADPAELCNPP